jgi:hypothetical protein
VGKKLFCGRIELDLDASKIVFKGIVKAFITKIPATAAVALLTLDTLAKARQIQSILMCR